MRRSFSFWYTSLAGVFLLLQGTSTLAARLIPAIDQSFPALLATTQMVPSHSLLHIFTALLAFGALYSGKSLTRLFALCFGLFYLGLGVFGMASGLRLGLGLQAFDHPFHMLLGALGLAAYWKSPA